MKKGKSSHESITAIFEIANDVDEEKLKAMKAHIDEINATLSNEKRVNDFYVAKEKLPLTASMKVRCSMSIINWITVPPAWQPKQ